MQSEEIDVKELEDVMGCTARAAELLINRYGKQDSTGKMLVEISILHELLDLRIAQTRLAHKIRSERGHGIKKHALIDDPKTIVLGPGDTLVKVPAPMTAKIEDVLSAKSKPTQKDNGVNWKKSI